MTRLYISAPMTGYEGLNIPAINEATRHYRSQGYEVVSPVEICAHINVDYEALSLVERKEHWKVCMRLNLAALVTCDEIIMLPNWDHSEGATLERHNALKLGMKIHYHAVEHAGA